MPNNVLQQNSPRRRGRPRLPAEKRRTHSVRLRLNDAELERLEKLAERTGEAMATYCRHAALDAQSTASRTDRTTFRELRQLRRDLFFALDGRHAEPVHQTLVRLRETADDLLDQMRAAS